MARSGRTGRSSASDVMAVMMAHPAEGPALMIRMSHQSLKSQLWLDSAQHDV